MFTALQAQRLTAQAKKGNIKETYADVKIKMSEYVDSAIKEACTMSEAHFVILKYNTNMHFFLNETYKPKGYKIKINYTQGPRDGGYPESIKLSWYPKQN